MVESEGYQEPKKRRKLRFALYIVIFLIVAIGSVGGRWLSQRNTDPIPRSASHGLKFTLYYPYNLPAGYSVDPTSFSNEDGVLVFYINSQTGNKIGVSEQALPADLNLSIQNNSPPVGIRLPTENFSTSVGPATIDQWADKRVSYIVTDKTWIIINVTGMNDDAIRSLTRSFAQSP